MRDIEKGNVLKYYFGAKQIKIIFCLVIVLFFILVFLLNKAYPLCLDDWLYSFVYGENTSVRVSSLYDIVHSQYNHYFIWGGRSVVHTIAQFLLMQNKWLIDLLNSLVYILYIFLIYKICNYQNQTNITLFLFINAAVWFLTPTYLFSTVWIVGSANYLWGSTIRLLFIIPYCIYFRSNSEDNKRVSYVKIILFFFGGIIAGWTNENTSAAMLFLLFSFFVYWKICGRVIPLWVLFGMVGAIIGFAFMVFAPGNYARTESIMGVNSVSFSFSFGIFYRRLYSILYTNIVYFIIAYVSYSFLVVWYLKKNSSSNKDVLFLSLLFFVSANVSMLVMIASPAFPPTVWSGILMYIFLSFGILFANIHFQVLIKRAVILLALICTVGLFVSYKNMYTDVCLFSVKLSNRINYINSEKAKGNRDIIIKKQIDVPGVFSIYLDVTEDTASWQNQCYLAYFDINSIVYKPR